MRLSRILLASSLLAFALSSCSCAPSKAGDSCDATLDENPCPTGLVCQPTPDGGTCFVLLGGSCDKEADDAFCANGAACAGADPVCGGEGATCATAQQNCASELICEQRSEADDQNTDEEPGRCAAPLELRGRVIDAETGDVLADADVIALDGAGVALTRVATTDAEGAYALRVPAARDADGRPQPTSITLRVAARDHQPFPGGVRTALPIALDDAETADAGAAGAPVLVVESPLTTVALSALPAPQRGYPTLAGTVAAGGARAGVLVVAEPAGADAAPAPSALSDTDGVFRIFNVPPGGRVVRGYAEGVVLTAVPVDVSGDERGIVLERVEGAGAAVSGSVQIVNAPGGAATSVVLVPRSTFVQSAVRGEVPRGLRAPSSGAPSIDGAFTIEGVPPGSYVVLAAFENDGLVRDPDPAIAGTQLVFLDVEEDDSALSLDESFKITEALAVVAPGADGPQLVDAPPTFTFKNEASTEFFTVEVFDSFGALVWTTDVTAPAGNGDVDVLYEGPALDDGAFYQFRATSFRDTGPISRTEDLRGVFVVAR